MHGTALVVGRMGRRGVGRRGTRQREWEAAEDGSSECVVDLKSGLFCAHVRFSARGVRDSVHTFVPRSQQQSPRAS
eukprot:4349368-Pleurochrysis_carterae.AAC.1